MAAPRTNPSTTSEAEGGQLLYKLGSLEAEVRGMSLTLTSAVDRLENRIREAANTSDKLVEGLEARVIINEKKLGELSEWRQNLVTKMGFFASAISLFWVMFGSPIKNAVEGVFR